MCRVDKLHLDYPFAGSRMLQGLLLGEGYKLGRLHILTLMKRMGIEAIYRRPNQVWAMDITYIPIAKGFVYLAAVVDWFSRRVLAWRLSIVNGSSNFLRIGNLEFPSLADR
jgi:putative transposase